MRCSRIAPAVSIAVTDMKALIAMSGGVDSSVAAYLMKEKGYECLGATMRLYTGTDEAESTCCSLADVEDARSVAVRLGMPFYVFNFTDDFKWCVIDRFTAAYERGETPNPCIDCNRFLKFERFYRRAVELGCDVIVTGHYAQIEQRDGRWLLKKAADLTKDQSYVLYAMTQEQLAHTVFPLGGMTKAETRELAEAQGFLNARKHDSQDICFVPNGDYAAVIEQLTGKTYPAGDFVDANGSVLGQHKGVIRYTIGQRKGLGLSLKEPLYVCEKRVSDNTVVLGKNEDLFKRELIASDFNWIAWDTPPITIRCKARIRYQQPETDATVYPEGDTVRIVFDQPQRAIAKGQAVVLYDGDYVLGGGTIK